MRILIISQHLFPRLTPRAHRTTELVKELCRQGHEVTLYAVLGKYDYSSFEQEYGCKIKPIPIRWMWHPYNSDGDKRRTLIDKILGRILGFMEFPNLEFKYRVPSILESEQGNYDLLITIADPHQIHWGAAHYFKKIPSRKDGIVWVGDCGDPYVYISKRKKGIYYVNEEHLFCKECDYISVPVEQAKEGYFTQYHSKIRVIPQGFQFEESPTVEYTDNTVPTFGYAGMFYEDIRNPHQFFTVLRDIDVPFQFIIYTPFPELVVKYKEMLGDKLIIRSSIPREELLKELRKMDFLVNIENSNSPAQIPSKLIDYAICGKPILSINPQNVDVSMVEAFIDGDYSQSFIVEDVQQYNIARVARQFLDLARSSS